MKRWPFIGLTAAGALSYAIGAWQGSDPTRLLIVACMTLLAGAFAFAVKEKS